MKRLLLLGVCCQPELARAADLSAFNLGIAPQVDGVKVTNYSGLEITISKMPFRLLLDQSTFQRDSEFENNPNDFSVRVFKPGVYFSKRLQDSWLVYSKVGGYFVQYGDPNMNLATSGFEFIFGVEFPIEFLSSPRGLQETNLFIEGIYRSRPNDFYLNGVETEFQGFGIQTGVRSEF